jgi:hypothetical protein
MRLQLAAYAQAGEWESLSSADAPSKWTGGLGIPFPAQAWAVEDGTLHLHHPKRGGSLYSSAQFDNFELEFEWRISVAGNSGVKYMGVAGRIHPDFHRFVTRPAALQAGQVILGSALAVWLVRRWRRSTAATGIIVVIATAYVGFIAFRYQASYRRTERHPTGLEYQLTDDPRNEDALLKPSHRTGALYDMIAPANAGLLPIEQYNRSRILVRGPHVEHWLNGRQVLAYEFESDTLRQALAKSKFAGEPGFARKSTGYLELQNHGDEVWFRNMRVRRSTE